MKNKLITVIVLVFLSWSCSSDFLDEKNETDLSVDFIYNTPEGIGLAVTALYPIERNMSDFGDNTGNGSLPTTGLSGADDITFTRAGDDNWRGPAWYDITFLNPLHRDVLGFWQYNYRIIGKANEIIFYANKMDKTNPKVIQALAEAYCFRAQAYFNLLRKYDNIYFTTDIVTPSNLNDVRTYAAAKQSDVMTQIKADLDYAASNLSWIATQKGRYTQGVARHIKALADMWPIDGDLNKMDLDDAIVQVEKIATQGPYRLMTEPKDVFTPTSTSALSNAKLNNAESIYVEQWGNAIGGAALSSTGVPRGHRFASSFLARYERTAVGTAAIIDMTQGGVPWGRIYPNDYLLSLYNRTTDRRYSQYYIHDFKFNNIPIATPLVRTLTIQSHDIPYLYVNGLPNNQLGLSPAIMAQLATFTTSTAVGKVLNFSFVNGNTIPKFMTSNYANDMHPSSAKYYDVWTRDILFNPSFKDIIRYRLAETFLIGAEAYLRKGNQTKALEFYNRTWTRAGNPTRTAALTLQDILDEDARELGQENYGHRWYVLKRFGANIMSLQIKTHAGSANYLNRIQYSGSTGRTSLASANATTAASYTLIRNNFEITRNIRWPIPQVEINAMGGTFPQNPNY
jgi:hypothetical protein